jgi:sugar phosphate isomerase/epimerase
MTDICERFLIGRNCWITDFDEYPEMLRRMRADGYRGWEFGCEPDHSPLPSTPGTLVIGQSSDHRWRRLREAFQGFDFVCAHAPFWHNEGVSLLYASRALREASIALLEETISFAADLGAHAVCFHIGHSWLPPDRIDTVLRHGLDTLVECAERSGVVLALENVPGEITFSLDRLAQIVAEYAHPRLKILLDTGHATLPASPSVPAPADASALLADFIRAQRDDIVEMHLHDNDAAGDRHWPVGRGVIDWARVCRAIVDSATPAALMIETRLDDDESRRALEGYLAEAL